MAAELLQRLTVGQLRQRAAAVGVNPVLVEQARDGDNPKDELVQLIVAQQPVGPIVGGELQALSVGELRQRAAAVGVDPALVEQARDGDDPKGDLVALILQHAPAAIPDANELAGLSVGALRQRCASLGIDPALVELARDSDDPKAELIAMLLEAAHAGGGPTRAELQGMTVGELRQRAAAAGVGPNSIEAARDSDNPKEDLVELILQSAPSLQVAVPTYGAPPAATGGTQNDAGRLSPARMRALAAVAGRLSPTLEPEPEVYPEDEAGSESGGGHLTPAEHRDSPHLFRAAALLGRLSPSRLPEGISEDQLEHEVKDHAATVIQTEWRGYDARVQFVSRRRLHVTQLEERKRADRALAALILEDLLDDFMPEIAPAFLARAVPAACASLAASHVVKMRSKHTGPEAAADLILQEYVDGVLRTLCHDAIR
jgi:hypothetical protein